MAMTLKEKVNEYKKVSKEIQELYKKKKAIEKTIVEELDIIDPKTYERKDEITLDDVVTLSLTYENNIDPELVREKFPTIFNFGQKLYFSWSQAVLAFENPKDFWTLMKECRVKKPKLKVEGVNKKWKKNSTSNLKKKS